MATSEDLRGHATQPDHVAVRLGAQLPPGCGPVGIQGQLAKEAFAIADNIEANRTVIGKRIAAAEDVTDILLAGRVPTVDLDERVAGDNSLGRCRTAGLHRDDSHAAIERQPLST